jgi:alkyl sulfatase BDS1-like metallo-beta-lactamase superfamily hydrolase
VHGVLNHRLAAMPGAVGVHLDARLTFDDVTSLLVIMLMPDAIGDFIDAGQIEFEGERGRFVEFMGYFEKFEDSFKIVEP